jgi:hypothetical protein
MKKHDKNELHFDREPATFLDSFANMQSARPRENASPLQRTTLDERYRLPQLARFDLVLHATMIELRWQFGSWQKQPR